MAGKNFEDYSGQNLLELRTGARISRRELLERLSERGVKMHQTTLRRIEDGDQDMKVSEAIAFADVFGIDVGKFVTEPASPWEVAIRSYLNSAKTFEDQLLRTAREWLGITSDMKEMLFDPELPPEGQSKAVRDLREYVASAEALRRWLRECPIELVEVDVRGSRSAGD